MARAAGREPGPAREWERLFFRLPALLKRIREIEAAVFGRAGSEG